MPHLHDDVPHDDPHHQDEGADGEHPEWEFTPEFWDQRYGDSAQVWSGNPNVRLVEQAGDLPPGTALDVGAGEGADAIWLAERGWTVTGIDVSQVALDRAAAHATQTSPAAAARITWQQTDITAWQPNSADEAARPPGVWEPAEASYDLVSAQFMHLPSEALAVLHARLASAVRPGGTLLVVGHHPHDLALRSGHRHIDAGMMPTAEAVAATLPTDEWDLEVVETQAREVTWPDSGELVTIHDAVLRARRR